MFSGLSLTREKDVFHWFGRLVTRQAKSPKAQGTCQSIHISHGKFFCIISFGNILKTLGGGLGDPGINYAIPPLNLKKTLLGVKIKNYLSKKKITIR